jgi:hypothetical protein
MDRTKQIELQQEFIDKGIEFYQRSNVGYLDLAMRIGKTRITLEILKKIVFEHATILISYPDNKLNETWKSECVVWEYDNPNITYVNFSSLSKYVDKVFDVFVIDEFHSASEAEREKCIKIIANCEKNILLSGTVTQEVLNDWYNPNCIGKYSTLDGIESGILADYQITVHYVNLDNKRLEKQKNGKMKTEKQKYDTYTWIIEKMKREKRDFMHLALARNRLSLNSIGKNEYLRKLLSRMKDKRTIVFTGLSKAADSIGVESYHSKSKDDSGFIKFQNKQINHLALAAMAKVGVTFNDLDSVILTNFTYNQKDTAQILNRAIKLDYKGKVADLHILVLNEEAEKKKLKETLSLLDQNKIKWNT